MALLTWNRSYSVGVLKIDSQHTLLFDILNDLHAALLKDNAQRQASPLLHQLVDYAQIHFSTEEAMMTAAKYSGLADHQVRHSDLIKKIKDYLLLYDKDEVKLDLKLLNFLRDWFTNHIQKVDMAYRACLLQHGVR